MHRNNPDNDGLQLVFGAPRQLQSLAGLEHGRTHSIGGYGAQFRFYLPAQCPRWGRLDVNGVAVKGLPRLTFPQVVFMGIAPK
jgi:hypothetical protein